MSTLARLRDDYDPPERDDPREEWRAQASEDELEDYYGGRRWRR